MSSLTVLLLGFAAFDGLVLGWALVGDCPRGEAVLLRLSTLGALWMARWMVMLAFGLEAFFGTIHLLYVDAVVGIPVAALFVLLRTRGRGVARALLIGAAAALLLALLGAYASLVEPQRLVVERAEVAVPSQRAGGEVIRVGVLADLQTSDVGAHEREAVNRLLDLEPDVIMIPGDVFDGSAAELERERGAMVGILSRLRAPHGTFAVIGDTDPQHVSEELLEPAGIELLRNEVAEIDLGDRRLSIAGVNKETAGARAAARAFERRPGARDIRLLLGHRPDIVLDLAPDSRVDLTVAGHTHGGQVQIPLFGPPVTLSEVPREVAAGGLHEVGEGRLVYVSRGVGMERGQAPHVRLGAVPEVTLIELG